MKIKQNIYVLAGLLLSLAVSSCKKWIEVTPRTQIESKLFFTDRLGFVEALNGAYIKMGSPNLYGTNMTFNTADVLGRIYPVAIGSVGDEGTVALYKGEYTNQLAVAQLTAIWTQAYSAIANLNNLLENLETADKTMFNNLELNATTTIVDGEYDRIKGEALGLRAYIHLDLLRMFTESYRVGSGNSQGIPYVTAYSPIATPRSTVKDVMEKIVADLKASEALLQADASVTNVISRQGRFNLYAAKGTLARAYLWKQDEINALAKAEEVIAASNKFPFTSLTALTSSSKNLVMAAEQMFGLKVEKMKDNISRYLDTLAAPNPVQFKMTVGFINEIYENSNTDFRRQYLIRDLSSDLSVSPGNRGVFYNKLYQPQTFLELMPLMKIPEMYYIAAECLSSTNSGRAVGYLNTVRQARALTALSTALSPSAIMDEVRKEYRKEMPLEGQMFYYYKRLNFSILPGWTGAFPANKYVLPLPEQEIDFGF